MANFSFNNLSSGSVYFTYETVRNYYGFYDSGSLKAASGSFTNITGVNADHIVQSDYIWSVVVPEGASQVEFIPAVTVPTGSVYFRGTGNLSVIVTT